VRPAVGGFTVGFVYMTIVSLMCTLIDPIRAGILWSIGGTGAMMSAWIYACTALIAAATVHGMWHYRLQKFGAHAFHRTLSVQIPQQQAFELCLAAASHIKDQRILGFDDQKGEIRIQTPPSSWLYEHTDIDIHLAESLDGVTHISLSAQKAVTRCRMTLLKMMWGEKWIPLILAVGNREQHDKALDELADHIRAMPNWNYAHAICSYEDEIAS